jgi:hypothetical protein
MQILDETLQFKSDLCTQTKKNTHALGELNNALRANNA